MALGGTHEGLELPRGKWSRDPTDDLAVAEARAIDHHIVASRARRAKRLLEIGCRTDALLRRAVERYGVTEAVGLAETQRDAEGIGADASIAVHVASLDDFRSAVPYDAIVCTSALAQLVEGATRGDRPCRLRSFFARCYDLLVESGALSIETIALGPSADDYPGCPPRLEELFSAWSPLFAVDALEEDSLGYVRTCRAWRNRLGPGARAVALDRLIEAIERGDRLFYRVALRPI